MLLNDACELFSLSYKDWHTTAGVNKVDCGIICVDVSIIKRLAIERPCRP